MKRTIFVVLTALVMSLSFMACSSSSPEEQMIGYMEDLVSVMKDTHIKSGSDVKTFAKKVKKIQDNVDALKEKYGNDYKSELSEEEQKKMEERLEKLMSDLFPEMQRIQKEATNANLTEEELEELRDAIR